MTYMPYNAHLKVGLEKNFSAFSMKSPLAQQAVRMGISKKTMIAACTHPMIANGMTDKKVTTLYDKYQYIEEIAKYMRVYIYQKGKGNFTQILSRGCTTEHHSTGRKL